MIASLIAAAALAAGAADVGRLSWMSGTWIQEREGGAVVQETWLSPRDGVMAGVSQTARPGRKPFVEYARISAEPAGVTFTAILPGQPPTPFVMLPSEDGEAVFENKAHDFPQRVVYRRCGEDLCAGIEGVQDGRPRREDWRYKRVR
jgi:hypothetical protein